MTCKILKDIVNRIARGDDPEEVFPYELPEDLDDETLLEIYHLGLHYLKSVDRREVCKRKIADLEKKC